MNVTVVIQDGALATPQTAAHSGAGAVVAFEGIVRELEEGRRLDALHYDTYEPMAQNMLEAIARELANRHDLLAVHVTHSRGRVAVGACSFCLIIASLHRKEALVALDEFIDRMKKDVPIWKRPVWAEESWPQVLSDPG